jgi:hypothetical protein
MPAMGSDASPDVTPPSAPGATDAQRMVRYNYLVGRLRGRQITMEEATELFGLMQGMLRISQLAARAGTMAPASRDAPARPAVPLAPGSPPASDDLFLIGILAMGAGAGLMAAMAQRLAAGTPTPARPEKGSTSRRDA